MRLLPRKDVILKQLGISLIPLVLSILYAGYQYWSDDQSTFTTFINYFAGSFFFLMWIVGQYLRTAKQIDDSSNYQDIQSGLAEVKDSLDKLKKSSVPSSPTTPSSNQLLNDAKQAIEDGHTLAGLMQAGVALEQAIISKVKSLGLYRDDRIPVSKAINSLRNSLPEGTIGELFALWKLRNQLVHLTPEASEELSQRPELIKYFEWAIGELEK